MSYQLIQTQIAALDNIKCPHCNDNVIDWAQEQYVQPCEHVLFIAMDLGFEYITDEFEQTMSRCVDDIHAHDDQMNMLDELTKSTYSSYTIYQSDLGAQNLSRYVGFKD
jgi:hypothetical protein